MKPVRTLEQAIIDVNMVDPKDDMVTKVVVVGQGQVNLLHNLTRVDASPIVINPKTTPTESLVVNMPETQKKVAILQNRKSKRDKNRIGGHGTNLTPKKKRRKK
jgi:hypothetical protein